MDSYAAQIWNETLMNEQRQQMKDWAVRNSGRIDDQTGRAFSNPLDFVQNPMPRTMVRTSDVASAPVSIPRNAPVDTKNPFQIRDPTFILPGNPAAKPKFYAGRRSRRKSCLLPGVTAATVPGITSGLGGYRALGPEAQEQLTHYPPLNPLAKKSQSTPGLVPLPGSTTFGFGYNFHRATRDAPRDAMPQFRPPKMVGECSLKDF